MQSNKNKIKGRGTDLNPGNRFEKILIDNNFFDDVLNDPEIEKINPETVFLKDTSRSAIAKNDSYDVAFEYSVNPYRGCEHGCVYCYARPTHEFLGFSSGLDFETKIMVKEDIVGLLESAFKKKSYKPDVIMLSGNTDCYQPIERKLELTRKLLVLCLKYQNPVGIITKSSMIQRDVDILTKLAGNDLVMVTMSITSLDRNIQRIMEPRASTLERRVQTIKILADNNIPVGVNLAPIIPGLNDEEIPSILQKSAENGALFANYIMLRLPFSLKDLFTNWLEVNFPDRKEKIINKIKEMRDGMMYKSDFGTRFTGEGKTADMISSLFNLSCNKYGLNKKKIHLNRDDFNSNGQEELFH